jgi:hypothetical protein
MWFSRRMMHFERVSKNWSQILYTHLTHTHQLLLPPVNTSLDQPAGYREFHLLDPVVNLTQLVNFTVGESRWALSQSNNNVDVAADIIQVCSLVHPCPLFGFVLMSLSTDHHLYFDVGVGVIHLSLSGPDSLLIRFLFNNRYLKL